MSTTAVTEYVPRLVIRARRVLNKHEQHVTTDGLVTAFQHDYIIETPKKNDAGETYYVTSVLDNDAFNEQYRKRDDDDLPPDVEDIKRAAYDEGFNDGWRKCEDASETADDVVKVDSERVDDEDGSVPEDTEPEPEQQPETDENPTPLIFSTSSPGIRPLPQ